MATAAIITIVVMIAIVLLALILVYSNPTDNEEDVIEDPEALYNRDPKAFYSGDFFGGGQILVDNTLQDVSSFAGHRAEFEDVYANWTKQAQVVASLADDDVEQIAGFVMSSPDIRVLEKDTQKAISSVVHKAERDAQFQYASPENIMDSLGWEITAEPFGRGERYTLAFDGEVDTAWEISKNRRVVRKSNTNGFILFGSDETA